MNCPNCGDITEQQLMDGTRFYACGATSTDDGACLVRSPLCKSRAEANKLREMLKTEREAVARFLVPWSRHLDDSWLDHFVEAGIVKFDGMGFIAAPVDETKPKEALG